MDARVSTLDLSCGRGLPQPWAYRAVSLGYKKPCTDAQKACLHRLGVNCSGADSSPRTGKGAGD